MHADGITKREIARRLGISRNTVERLLSASEPPWYSRAPAGSMLDPLEPVLRRLVEEWPEIKAPRVTEILREDCGYTGSVDLVRKRLATLRPRQVRPAQRTGYRPGQVLQLDWGEMPTRPKLAGRERRIYALVATLPSQARRRRTSASISRPRAFWRGMFGSSTGSAASFASASMTTCAQRSRDASATRSPGISGSSRSEATTRSTRTHARRRRRARRAQSRAASDT
jgi:transcriptional regulator with XRE-family HTH domain